MCEFSPTWGHSPCEGYLEYRAEVFAVVTREAARQYPDHADSVVLQALLAPMGYSHQSPIRPAQEAQRLIRKAWAVVRLWNPRPVVPGLEFPVAPSKVYDAEADSAHKIREHDIPEMVLDRALDDLEKDWWHLEDTQITQVVDTMGPLLAWLTTGGHERLPVVMGDSPVPTHLAKYATKLATEARRRVLSDLGSIGSTKHKRGMTKGHKRPTMGPASEVIHCQGNSPEHYTVDSEGKRHYLSQFEQTVLASNPWAVKPKRVGTERAEEADDRILDYRRPVAKGNTRKNKRSGRMGGSAIVR